MMPGQTVADRPRLPGWFGNRGADAELLSWAVVVRFLMYAGSCIRNRIPRHALAQLGLH